MFSNPDLNPEKNPLKQIHTVNIVSSIIPNSFIIGFEDLNREKQTDDDFNDAILMCTVSSLDAINTRSLNYQETNEVKGTILCDDQIITTNIVNNDFSDGVFEFHGSHTIQSGRIKKISLTYHFKHRSTVYDHTFGVQIPNIHSIPCSIEREMIIGNGEAVKTTLHSNASNELVVFPSTKTALPASGNHSHYANTAPGWNEGGNMSPVSSSRIVITFNGSCILPEALNSAKMPYFPYLKVFFKSPFEANNGKHYYVRHGQKYPGASRLGLTNSTPIPKIIFLPDVLNYQCTHERYSMVDVFPDFKTYEESNCTQASKWYNINRPQYLNPLITTPTRTWTI
jgi:LruC domain-containing protein